MCCSLLQAKSCKCLEFVGQTHGNRQHKAICVATTITTRLDDDVAVGIGGKNHQRSEGSVR